MSKRSSLSGDSPTPKSLRASQSSHPEGSQPDSLNYSFLSGLSAGSRSEPLDEEFIFGSFPFGTEPGASSDTDSSQQDLHFPIPSSPTVKLEEVLNEDLDERGIELTAETILANPDLKAEIMRVIFLKSHTDLKSSLKKSQLCADKSDRNFLLTITPESLCEEFKVNSSSSFNLVVQGLLGISDPEVVFESQVLLNNLTFIYSTVSKVINRKATNYALLMTTALRDGGLREDSLKMFSMLVHPRTSQKYDKEVLAEGWDEPLANTLEAEKEHFTKIHDAVERLTDLEDNDDRELIEEEIGHLLATVPPQVQQVWDNLNLRAGIDNIFFLSYSYS